MVPVPAWTGDAASMMAAATILERLIMPERDEWRVACGARPVGDFASPVTRHWSPFARVARDRRRQLPGRAQITTPSLSASGVADESRSAFPHLVRRVTFAVDRK